MNTTLPVHDDDSDDDFNFSTFTIRPSKPFTLIYNCVYCGKALTCPAGPSDWEGCFDCFDRIYQSGPDNTDTATEP